MNRCGGAVRTRFGPEDENAFYATRDELIDSYRSTTEQDTNGFVASTMLEYKWGYADGRIFHWTRPDLEDLLLGHFPGRSPLTRRTFSGWCRRSVTSSASSIERTDSPETRSPTSSTN
jgi:hypothetical protein